MVSYSPYNWVTSLSPGDRLYRGMLKLELDWWTQRLVCKIPKLKSFSPQLFWAAQYSEMYSVSGPVVLIEIPAVVDPSEWTFEPLLGCGPSEVRCLVERELRVVRFHDYERVLHGYFQGIEQESEDFRAQEGHHREALPCLAGES